MNKLLFIPFMLFAISCFSAESRTVEDILNQKETKKFSYILNTGVNKAVVINMQFGGAEVISNSDRMALRKAEVFQVDIVYSDFPKGIDMEHLNRKRLAVIQRLRTDLIGNPKVKWKLIRQVRCRNEAEAKTLFHGIVVHYRPEQSKETILMDTRTIETLLPPSDVKMSKKDLRAKLRDTTILSVFRRNRDWKDMVVVSDLTGSMSPYVAQLVLWFRLNELNKRVNHVTFFNDGDMKQTKEKVIGRTGGIYHGEVMNYDSIRSLALTTIRNGGGGDMPENDVEAILAAIKKNPKAKSVVLIADNWAHVKDFSLVEKLDRPVHVILCGTQFGVNVEYLELARKTGGSVHTMKKDLKNLAKMSEGKKFMLDGSIFQIKNGKVIQLSRT